MRHISFFVLSIFYIGEVSAQNSFIVLKDGKRIEIKNFNLYPDKVEVKTLSKEKIQIAPDNIAFFFQDWDQQVTYCKPIVDDYQAHPFKKLPYEFLPRILEGEIKVYTRGVVTTTYSAPGSYPYSPMGRTANAKVTYDLFLEKGNEYQEVEEVNNVLGLSHKKSQEAKWVLTGFLRDNPKLTAKVSQDNFKMSYEGILDVVREYNVLSFENECIDQCKKGSTYFYADMMNSKDDYVRLIINDSVQYKVPKNVILPVSLCMEHPSKICLGPEGREFYNLLSASPAIIEYYEVGLMGNNKPVTIRKMSTKKAQEFLYKKSHPEAYK